MKTALKIGMIASYTLAITFGVIWLNSNIHETITNDRYQTEYINTFSVVTMLFLALFCLIVVVYNKKY